MEYTIPPRVPDELLHTPLPDWVKLVWIAIRKTQGNNEWAFGSQNHYAKMLGKKRPNISTAISLLKLLGWLEFHPHSRKKVRCAIGEFLHF